MSSKVYPTQGKIKALRATRGWDQESACVIAGISIRTYQRVESGDGCSIESLKGIASAFGMDFNELLDPQAENATQGEEYTPSWQKALIAFIVTGCMSPFIYGSVISLGMLGGMTIIFALVGAERELTTLAIHANDPAVMNHLFEVAGKSFQELPSSLLEVTLALTVFSQLFFILVELPKNKDYSLLVSQPLWNKIKLSTQPVRNKLKKGLIQLHKKYPITNCPEDLGVIIALLPLIILMLLNMPFASLAFSILFLFLLSEDWTKRHEH